MFDLSALDTVAHGEKGIPLEIKHPVTEAPLGITFTVHGKDSERYRSVVRAQQDRRFQVLGFQRPGAPKTTPRADQIESDAIDILTECVSGWSQDGEPTIVFEGKRLPFSPENARMVLERIPCIREQVDAAIHDRALFIES